MQGNLEGVIKLKHNQELRKFIPPEFDLSHYAGTAKLGAHGWLACLWHRFNGDVLGNGYICKPKPIQWKAPLNCQLPDEFLNYSHEDLSSVSFLDSGHIINTTNTPDTYAYLRIDLDNCDNFLIEDFKTELELARNRAGITARTRIISESEFRNWHEAKILQYMDISHWHELSGLKATQNQIGDILFPEDDRGATGDRTRRTVHKHIETVTSRKTIISLLTQMFKERKRHEKIEKS